MTDQNSLLLSRFGFRNEKGSVHTPRTMMLNELSQLIDFCKPEGQTKDRANEAVVNQNCLGKRPAKTKILTFRHLIDLYSLDSGLPVFRALLYFWQKEEAARPLLALLCAYVRDGLLRATAQFILSNLPGAVISREMVELFIQKIEPERFSAATLKSTAQNINSTLTKSGHLEGKVKKLRIKAKATTAAVSFALFLGFVQQIRGENLFCSEYIKLLNCSFERAIELAELASMRGLIVLKKVENVIEVQFPNLISSTEMELLRE